MKKLLAALLFASATLTMTSCGDDDEGTVTPETNNNITENTTWKKGDDLILRGNVYVESGVTLTIEPGTVVKGDKASKGALIVSRGAKIVAQGTASDPIVFTSNQPVGQRDRGDWGGVVILGRARANNLDGSNSAFIEGISAPTGDNGLYGGTNDSDNSGILEFVRIEFAGIALNPDNELNSLTMGAVGSGTKINHIQVSYAGDDAFEWFGGTVSHEYMVALRTLDDDFDTDKGYTGKLQYGLVMRDPQAADVSGSRAMEASSSSTAGDAPVSHPIFANFTLLGPKMFTTGAIAPNFKHGVRADKDSDIELHNSIIAGFPTAIERNDTTSKSSPSFSKNILVNNTKNYAAFSVGDPNNATNIEAATGTVFGAIPLSLTNGNAGLQVSGSTYNSGAQAITGFKASTFYGAFGSSADADWNYSDGWLEFDPQNKAY